MEKIWYESYPEGVPREIDLNWHRSLVSLLEDSFDKYRQQPAYANLGKTLTYDEVDRASRGFAVYLKKELHLGKGDRVALMMPNILQYPVALFGVLRAGLVAVNVNPLYTKRELQHQLKDSGAKAIVILANFAHTLEKCLAETDVKHVMVTQLGDMLSFPKSALINFVLKYVKKMVPSWQIEGALPFKKVMMEGNPLAYTAPEVNPEDLAFLQYTGGTTGVSKGAMLTHRNITANVAQAKLWIGKNLVQGKEVVLTPLPLYHIFALTANCFTFITLGALNVLITNPRDIGGFVKEMGKWEFTSMTGVNTLFNALLNHPDFKNLNFRKFRLALGGGMAVQRPVAEKWKEVTGIPLVEAYGLTETSPAVCINPLTIKDYNGYIGLPVPSTDVTIRDDAGKELAQGEVGELCVKGPQVMKGYWNRPDETAKVFYDDRVLKTGDMAIMTEDGYLKIVDRKKDMILVSGFNVYPNEIEDVVAAHEKVLEVAAVGVPDPKSTEAVKLFVVKKDPSLTEEELKAFCKENLTAYKCPKHIEFRDELPKTNVGKILRRALRDE